MLGPFPQFSECIRFPGPESEAYWRWDNRRSTYILGRSYCVRARPRTPASAENIHRTPLQAEPFIAEGTRSNGLPGFDLACGHPRVLRVPSFGKPGTNGRNRLGCCSLPGSVRLGF